MKRRYKIAVVAACPFPYPRGTPIRIFRMAEALARSGAEVHAVTYNLGENLEEKDHLYPFRTHRTRKVKTYKKLSPGPSGQKLLLLDTLLAFRLLQVLRQFHIDIIHAHHYEGLIIALLARKIIKTPVVYDAHTMLESELPFYNIGLPGRAKQVLGKLLDYSLPKQADHIITVTEDIRHKLITNGHIADKKVSVVMNGIESEHFAINPEKTRQGPEKVLIYTGNMAQFQGIELLLHSFQRLLSKRDGVRLLIVTDGSFAPYQALADELGIMSCIDLRTATFEEIPQYLQQADIALNPRVVCDGIPQKLLNYMAAGKPIVSFAGSAKILEHGTTGAVVDGANPIEFADAVLRLLDNPVLAQRLGMNAQKLMHAEYGWEKQAEKILRIYEQVVYENIAR